MSGNELCLINVSFETVPVLFPLAVCDCGDQVLCTLMRNATFVSCKDTSVTCAVSLLFSAHYT